MPTKPTTKPTKPAPDPAAVVRSKIENLRRELVEAQSMKGWGQVHHLQNELAWLEHYYLQPEEERPDV